MVIYEDETQDILSETPNATQQQSTIYRVLRKGEQNTVLYLSQEMTFQNMNDLRNYPADISFLKKKNFF